MKKFIVSAVMAVITCMPMLAQSELLNNPNNKAYFGLRVGADIACPGKITADKVSVSTFKNGAGIEFGGIYNIPVVANFYIEPGVKLYYDTYSLNDEMLDALDLTGYSFRKFGMRIPVMAGYHFDFTEDIKVSVFTGPELEIGIWGREYAKDGKYKDSANMYGDDGLKRVNVLWGIGAGVSYQRYYLGFNGGIGMVNMISESGTKFHENRVTISLGYNF